MDRFVGTWRSVETQGPGAAEQNPVELTYSRCLGGKFVQELGKLSGEDTAMIMYSYDVDQNVFRLWRFATNDPPSEATGVDFHTAPVLGHWHGATQWLSINPSVRHKSVTVIEEW